jgi:predicted ATPase
MMMAHDKTPGHPELSAASVDALEKALRAYLVDDSGVSALQPALRHIAVEAREKKIHAEHLLIALKDVWFGLPEMKGIADAERQSKVLQRVVTLCIREYYTA